MLPSLPEELLAHIFSYLALPSAARLVDIADDRQGHSIEDIRAWKNMQLTQQTLVNICLSSKTLYRLAWPTLYSAYSTWLASEGSTSSAYFLRTLCLKPEYGKILRSFSIRDLELDGGLTMDTLYHYADLLTGDAITMATFQWRARNFWLEGYEGGLIFQDRLVRSLLIGLDDAIMCMVLLMCPNITELDISMPYSYQSPSLVADLFAIIVSPQTEQPPSGSVFEPASSRYVASQLFGTSWPDAQWQQPAVLEFLSEFTLRSGDNVAWEPLLTHVTLLPSLKTLKIFNLIEGPSQDWLAAIMRRKSPQLRILHLAECSIGDTSLCDIVQLFPNLRTLSIDWSAMYHGFIPMREIGRAIARYTPRVMHLTLDASSYHMVEDSLDEAHRMSSMLCDSIKNMAHLERLKVSEQPVWTPLLVQNGRGLETESREVKSCIGHALPTKLAWLEVVFQRHPSLYWEDHNLWAEYQRWQDRDLRALLLDESFTKLRRVDIHGFEREVCTRSVRESGWLREAIEIEGGGRTERLSRQ